jgi:hypothetical protein
MRARSKSLRANKSRLYTFAAIPTFGSNAGLHLQPLEGLNGVVEGSVLGDVSAEVLLDEVGHGVDEELDVRHRVVALNLLVEVRIEGNLLDVLALAHLNEGLTSGVGVEEHLLENVKHSVGGAVGLVEIPDVGVLNVALGGKLHVSKHSRQP